MVVREGDLLSGATFSDCGLYRYKLWRYWDADRPTMVFVMMNPSTADAKLNDPTVSKCINFAKRDGFGGIDVLNVFALRATDPRKLVKADDPFGVDNWFFLREASQRYNDMPVLAWGNRSPDKRLSRYYDMAIRALSHGFAGVLYCLGTNKSGDPKHPLYLAANTKIIQYVPVRRATHS